MRAVELFTGAGGLGMGLSLAGFHPLAVVEWDRWACDTIRENQRRDYPLVRGWPLHERDVRSFDFRSLTGDVDLVAGGPPCQPFSMGGKHQAYDDQRDMFPVTVEAVRTLRPRAFIIENVKGLTRSAFANYYQYILLQLEFPEIVRHDAEDWFVHFLRLQAERTAGRRHASRGLTYNVVPTLVNAANFGVPQKRERVFIVGIRSDLGIQWSFPEETHCSDALIFDQWASGDYWDRHRIAMRNRPPKPRGIDDKIARLKAKNSPAVARPWMTIRDAFQGLPDPEATDGGMRDHKFQAGARSYPGHTGSPFDLPAKTLKAGDHGVPGGENMLVKDDGSVRYFTIRESARLQTFPDGYVVHGSWTETMRQLGNAVPVTLAQIVARSVAIKLIEHDLLTTEKVALAAAQ